MSRSAAARPRSAVADNPWPNSRLAALIATPSASVLIEHAAVVSDQLQVQRHLPRRVRRTAQARVEGTNAGLHAVEHPLGDERGGPLDVVPGDLGDGPVHRQVVL